MIQIIREVYYGEYMELKGQEEYPLYYCDKCMSKMANVSGAMFKCGRCGLTFKEGGANVS